MNTQRNRASWRRTPRRLLLLLACLLTAATAGTAPAAHAGTCSACGPPTLAQLSADPAFGLEQRLLYRDYYEVSGGACDVTITGGPRIRKIRSYFVLRGKGEVWNCPHSKSTDQITASVDVSDTTGWSVSTSFGAKLGAFGATLESKIVTTVTATSGIRTTTTISKSIHPSYCVRMPWEAWFEIGEYKAEVDYTLKRRFAWWTKNVGTGSTVHRSGDIWIDCGSGTGSLGMQAPISGHFRLWQRGCSDPECHAVQGPKDLGWFPPLSEDPSGDSDDTSDDDAPVPGGGESDDDDPDEDVPPSGELPDPPAGIPDPPPGFETGGDGESDS